VGKPKNKPSPSHHHLKKGAFLTISAYGWSKWHGKPHGIPKEVMERQEKCRCSWPFSVGIQMMGFYGIFSGRFMKGIFQYISAWWFGT
jgi:hypothetical protein